MISRTCQLGMNSIEQRLRLARAWEDEETGSPGTPSVDSLPDQPANVLSA